MAAADGPSGWASSRGAEGAGSGTGAGSSSQLLRRLCVLLTGKTDDQVIPHFKLALALLASTDTGMIERDEFYVAEGIKKLLTRTGKTHQVTTFNTLHRKLIRNSAIQRRESILALLLSLAESTARSHTNVTRMPSAVGMLEPISMPALLWTQEKKKRQPQSQPALATLPPQGMKEKKFNEAHPMLKMPGKGVSKTVAESRLLRDILFVFQGIDGQYIKYDDVKERYQLCQDVPIPYPHQVALLRMSELGWLFRKVDAFCTEMATDPCLGVVGQALVSALREEMLEWSRLVAVLDAQLQADGEAETPLGEERPALTLRRLQVWTLEPAFRLRMLAVMVDSIQGARGGALVSTLYNFLQHGDPLWTQLVGRVLCHTCKPLLHMVRQWIVQGKLDDTHHEFFIASEAGVSRDRLWHDKYSLRKAMLPRFISAELAQNILATGKGINFLKEVAEEDVLELEGKEAWSKTLESAPVESVFLEQDAELQNTIQLAYRVTSRSVLDVMLNRFHVMDHLHALRKYLLLGQGDFIRYLMELLDPELNKCVTSLYPHTLTGILETAVRSTNAQYEDEDILNRLDTRLMETVGADTGWDAFTLDYHVNGPIGTVFTHDVMMTYSQLFSAFWRCKRMEWITTGLWKRQIIMAKKVRGKIKELSNSLHLLNLVTLEAVHMVHQTQYYMAFEVMACSWEALVKKINEAQSLDEFVAAHHNFLSGVKRAALMDRKSEKPLNLLRSLFDLIQGFSTWLADVEEVAEVELKRRKAYEDQAEERRKAGMFSLTAEEEAKEAKIREKFRVDYVNKVTAKLRVNGHIFQNTLCEFLKSLTSQPDISLQCLCFRLDFNEYYKSRDADLRSNMTYQHRRQSGYTGGIDTSPFATSVRPTSPSLLSHRLPNGHPQ